MNDATQSPERWAVSIHSSGEDLTAEAGSNDVHLLLVGIPQGFTRAEISGWLNDVAGVARETSLQDRAAKPIPGLLHHALTGLVFSQAELWSRTSGVPPCSVALVRSGDEVGFGWVGEADVMIWLDGQPLEVQWVKVRDDLGREALAWSVEATHLVQIVIRWGSSGGAATMVEVGAEWQALPERSLGAPTLSMEIPRIEASQPQSLESEPIMTADAQASAESMASAQAAGEPGSEPAEPPSSGVARWLMSSVPWLRKPAKRTTKPEREPEPGTQEAGASETSEAVSAAPPSPAFAPDSVSSPRAPVAAPVSAALPVERIATVFEPASADRLAPTPVAQIGTASRPAMPYERHSERELPQSIPPTPESIEVTDRAVPIAEPVPPPPAPRPVAPPPPIATSAPIAPPPIATPAIATPAPIAPPPPSATSTPSVVVLPPQRPAAPAPPRPASTPPPPPRTIPMESGSVVIRSSPAASPPPAPPPPAPIPVAATPEPAPAPEAAAPQVPWEELGGPTYGPAAGRAPISYRDASAERETGSMHEASTATPPHRASWPAPESLGETEVPLWKRPWTWAVAVAILLAVGWMMGSRQDTPKATRAVVPSSGSFLGMGGSKFKATIESDPPGAHIAVDGKPTGAMTPVILDLPTGSHRVTLSLTDLGEASYDVTGKKGEQVPLSASLSGALEVVSPDPSAVISVTVDGETKGFAPLTLDALAPGAHEIRFSGPGMASWGQTVEIRVGETKQILTRAMESPATGLINVRGVTTDGAGTHDVSGGQVWVDGESKGPAPLTLELARGPHSIRMAFRGQEAPIQVIDLPGGNQRFASFEFGPGADREAPRLAISDPNPKISRDRPTMITVALLDAQAGEVREMWLHVRTPEATWRRYQMTLLNAQGTLTGVAPFPIPMLDSQGRGRYYVSAVTAQGDEYFTEIESVQAGK